MTDEDFLRLAARADVARLLSAAYYEPGPEFGEERLFDSLAKAAQAVGGELVEWTGRLQRAFAQTDLQTMLVDYVKLFHGPPKALAQPYGAVWLSTDQAVMQESTARVLDLYRKAGFEMAEDFRDLPDHISAELECLYVLLFSEAQLLRQEDPPAAGAVADLRRRLLTEHLSRWVAPFAEAIETSAGTSFYRELAGLTRAFVLGEHEALSSRRH